MIPSQKPSDHRNERKFLISGLSLSELFFQVNLHPSGFEKHHEAREVNNVYFDTFELENYRDNVEGISNRWKTRLRWYGTLEGKHNPLFQFKIKTGMISEKFDYSVNEINFCSGTSWSLIIDSIRESLPLEERNILNFHAYPIVITRYNRHYFISSDKKFRLTIDHKIKYYDQANSLKPNFRRYESLPEELVLEIKYPIHLEEVAPVICSWFPFRVSKNSKYVSGIDLVWNFIHK